MQKKRISSEFKKTKAKTIIAVSGFFFFLRKVNIHRLTSYLLDKNLLTSGCYYTDAAKASLLTKRRVYEENWIMKNIFFFCEQVKSRFVVVKKLKPDTRVSVMKVSLW